MDKHKKILYITIILLISSKVSFGRLERVDPHDMNINIPISRDDSKHFNIGSKCQCSYDKHVSKDNSKYQLQKVIKLITGMTSFDRKSDDYKGIIDVRLNKADFDFLRNILPDHLNDEHVLVQLNEVLEKSLEKSIYTAYFFSITESIILILQNETMQLTLIISALLYVLWRIQPHNYNFTTLFKLFFPLVYISDFILRYKGKLEEVETDAYIQYESFKPCDPNRLGWIDWMYDKFTGYCAENKRTFLLSQRAATHIFTPLNVISDQFDVIVTILKHLGTAFGSFMWALIEQMPWYMKPFVGIFSFLLVIIMLLMLGTYIFGINPKLNLFHVLKFEFVHNSSITNEANQSRQDCISGENLKILLKAKSEPNLIVIPSAARNNSITYKTKSKGSVRKKPYKAVSRNTQIVPVSNGDTNET